jgi:hypothetical protein
MFVTLVGVAAHLKHSAQPPTMGQSFIITLYFIIKRIILMVLAVDSFTIKTPCSVSTLFLLNTSLGVLKVSILGLLLFKFYLHDSFVFVNNFIAHPKQKGVSLNSLSSFLTPEAAIGVRILVRTFTFDR